MPARPRARRSRDASPSTAVPPARVIAGRALLGGRLQPVELGVDEHGVIRRVARSIRGDERFDFGDRILLPSATDLHVHFRDPGGPEPADSFVTGTVQAALGGVGLVGEMPNTQPPVDSLERLRAKAERTRHRIAVDVLLYGLAAPAVDIARLAREAGAFKLYLSPTTGVDEAPSREEVRELLARVAATGLPLTVHAEDPHGFGAAGSATDLAAWNHARPVEAERTAVESLLTAPPELRLHVAHVTDAGIARRLAEAGHSFEATPHHLLLHDTGADARRKVNPPLRAEAVRAELFEEFVGGRIPILASDHAPHLAAAKELPFARAPSGVPGVETSVPLWLEECRRGAIPLSRLLAAACDRPARWFGAPMGRIAVGHYAHLMVVDFRERRPIRGARLHGPSAWSPFEGRTAVFPRHVLHYGETIVEEGEYVGRPTGRLHRPDFGRPSPTPPAAEA